MNPFKFIKEVLEQIRHITWPNNKTVIKLSLTVILVSVVSASVLGLFDVFFAKGFAEVSKTSAPPIDTSSLMENIELQESTPSAEPQTSN